MCKSFCQRKLYGYANVENVNIVMIKLAYTSNKNSFIIAILPYTMKNCDSYEEYTSEYVHTRGQYYYPLLLLTLYIRF